MTIEGTGRAAAVAAMSQIQRNVAATAGRAASGGAGDQLDLSAEMLALIQARAQHAALANVAQAAEEFAASTLSVLG
jgi:hypothetical protein